MTGPDRASRRRPSDPGPIRPGTNYGATFGPQFRWENGTGGIGVGMFAAGRAYGIRDCTDGSSNTVAASEKIAGDNTAGSNNGAEFYHVVGWWRRRSSRSPA